jgi:hypothetical protein
MNALQKDIIHLITRHGSMTSSQLQDRLNTTELGYNFELSHISKTASKMKSNGLLTSTERPNPGTKPVTYWALPEVVNQQMTTEMASDVAEVELAPPPSPLVDFLIAEAERIPEIPAPDYEPSTVAFPKRAMSVSQAMQEYADMDYDDPLGAFLAGIAAAERFHGIAE